MSGTDNSAIAHSIWFHHVGLSVPNLDDAIAWYGKMLGFSLLRRFHIDSIPADVAELRNGPMQIELFEVPGAQSLPSERREPNLDVRTHGHKHVSFATTDVLALADVLRARGVDVVWVRTFPWGSNAFIRDCAGNLIEIVEGQRPTIESAYC